MTVKNSQSIAFRDPGFGALEGVLARLGETGVVPHAAAALDDSLPSAGVALREAVLAEVPAYRASGNPDILPELSRHADAHALEIRRLIGGGEVADLAFVKDHAQRRAEQHFPLEAMLHAYRCGQRVFLRLLRDAAVAAAPESPDQAVSAVADFAIEYTNLISTIAASEYTRRARLLAEAEGDMRAELLNVLLSGYDESDGRVARLLKRAGYLDQRRAYCVVAAQPVNAAEMENLARAQRIASALSDAAAGASIRALSGVRGDLVVAVMSDQRRQSGWTPERAGLSRRIGAALQMLGPAVLAGVSADHPSTSFLPRALQEASVALDFAGVAKRVTLFAELPLRALLTHRGADFVRSAPPGWMPAFLAADRKSSGALMETLRALADADMNVQKAARLIGKHPNTLYARLERIKDVTGLDGQRYHDLTELLLVADCWRI